MRTYLRLFGLCLALTALAGCPDNEIDPVDTAVCGNGDVEGSETCDDGNTTGGDGCSASCVAESGGAEACGDGVDDDGDGLVDCDDPDCSTDDECLPAIELCDDGTDNDGDGDIDCDDDDCADDAACVVAEVCDDETDNDGDGDVDCDDADCAGDDACLTDEVCDDETDNDGDGDVDCDDADCDGDDACTVCGDGVTEGDEECDDGDDNSDTDADACRTTCVAASCGDGVVDTGEECDGGEDCTDECTLSSFCGDGVIDDGETCDDGDDNSDTEPDACRTNCEPASCGDATIDTGEVCDDGDDNSDLIPDACRSTCVAPSCGDGTVDSTEECDLGDDNGDAAECSLTCAVNVDIACAGVEDLIDLDVDGTVEDGVVVFAGDLRDEAADYEPGVGCVTDDEATAGDLMFVFRPAADGDYRITTDAPGTLADTVLYFVDGCTDAIPGDCNDDDGDGSTLFLTGATAGTQYFLVVDSVGLGGAFELRISPIAGVAGSGEDCSGEGVYCDVGLECQDDGDGGLACIADEAPVLTGFTATTNADGDVVHIFTGTDANRDVNGWELVSVTLADGSVEAGFASIFEPAVSWDGDAFEFELVLPYTAVFFQAATEVTAFVTDANGNASEPLTATVAPYVPPTGGLGEDDPCDIARVENVCDDPFTCTLNEDDSTTCGDPVAPVLDAVTADRVAIDAVRFNFEGSDVNGDVASYLVSFFDAGGVNVGDYNFGFDVTSFGLTEFGLRSVVSGLTPTFAATATISLLDDAGLESGELTVDIPVPSAVGEGEECDPAGLTATCEAPFVCSVGAETPVCAAAVAPVLTFVEAEYLDLLTLEAFVVYVEGTDENGDVISARVDVTTPDGGAGSLTLAEAQLTPSPRGRVLFSFETIDLLTEGTYFDTAAVTLIDSAGLESNTITDPLGEEVEPGDDCTPDGTGGACADGYTCGADLTCEEAVAPVLTSLSAIRQSEDEVRFIIEGSDANGDVTFQISELFDADDVSLTGEVQLVIDDDLTGVTTFTATSTITGFAGFDAAYNRLRLLDRAGLTSDALDVEIAPIVGVDEECTGDGVVDICADGSSCVDGFCTATPPTITGITALQNEENPRLMDFTVTGIDPDEDLESVVIDFFDGEGVSITGDLGIEVTVALVEAPLGVTYVDGEYEFRFRLNWEDPELYGIAVGSGVAFDSLGGESESFPFVFRPTVGLGMDCDLEEEVAYCGPGLVCIEDGLVCDVDPEDPCAGVPVIDVVEAGEPVEGEGVYVPFDSNGEDNLSEADCSTFGPSAGAEVAAYWAAPADGFLTVSTDNDATEFDTYIYARIGFCADPLAEVACNDDSGTGLQSLIEFEVFEGDDVYVYLDGWGSGGVGEALFTFVAYAELGDECDPDGFSSICVGDGLACAPSDDTFTCQETTVVETGDACDGIITLCPEFNACSDADICEPIAGSCADAIALADVATYDAETNTWTVSDDTSAYDSLLNGSCTNAAGGDIVYAFTAPAWGDVVASMTSPEGDAGYDTVLYVYEDPCGDADAEIACNDDDGGTRASTVEFGAAQDATYYFVVDGWGDAAGAFTLAVTLTETPGPGTDCVEDDECADGLACFEDVCTVIEEVATGEACDDIVALCPDTDLCFEDVCTTVTEVATGDACNDITTLCPDTDLCVDDICQTFSVGGPGEACDDILAFCEAPAVCADDVCVAPGSCATPLTFEEDGIFDGETGLWTVSGDTTGYENSAESSCGTATAGDQAIAWSTPVPGTVTLAMVGDYDTVLHVQAGGCGDGEVAACNDDGEAGIGTSELTFDAAPDVTYFIFADGWSGAEGAWTLTLDFIELGGVGAACESVDDCGVDLVCFEDLCSEVVTVPTGDACNEVTAVCGEGDACFEGLCTTITEVATGDACDDIITVCPDGDACFDDVCTTITEVATGEACNEITTLCADGDACFEDVCTTITEVATGDACNDLTTLCADGDLCVDDVCQTIVTVASGETCDDVLLVCPEYNTCEGETPVCVERGTCAAPDTFEGSGFFDDEFGVWVLEGSTTGLLNQAEGSCGSSTSSDYVIAWTPDADGDVFIGLEGDYDTVLHIQTDGCGEAGTAFACNDDGELGVGYSELEFVAEAGVTYNIVVDGWSGAEGAFLIYLAYAPYALEGEACEVDANCSGDLVCFEDVCTAVSEVATGDACNGVTTVCPDTDLCVDDVCQTFSVGELGDACDNIIALCPLNAVCDGGTDLCVAAGTCERPATFEEGGEYFPETDSWVFVGDTSVMTDTVNGTCNGGGAEDYVVAWTAPADGTLDVFMSGDYDTALFVLEGSCGDGTQAACNDDGVDGIGTSEVSISVTGATTYYIYADGWTGNQGTFALEAFFTPDV